MYIFGLKIFKSQNPHVNETAINKYPGKHSSFRNHRVANVINTNSLRVPPNELITSDNCRPIRTSLQVSDFMNITVTWSPTGNEWRPPAVIGISFAHIGRSRPALWNNRTNTCRTSWIIHHVPVDVRTLKLRCFIESLALRESPRLSNKMRQRR